MNYNYELGKYTFVKPDPLDIFTLAELKNKLSIPSAITSKDAELTLLLGAAIDAFMETAQMGILDTTFTVKLYGFNNYKVYGNDRIESDLIGIYRQQIHTINSIKYYKNNVLTTLASTNYIVDYDRMITEIRPATEDGFPTDYDTLIPQSKPGAVVIEFVSGFGATASDIPADVQQALLSYVMESYTNKGDCNCDGEINKRFNNLIAKYKYTNVGLGIM